MKQPLAYVHPDAKIADNVVIEPFVTIDANVEIGEGTWVGPNVTIMDGARIGKNCRIFPGAVISAIPQDLKFDGEKTTVEIGNNTTIRECVTVNRGTKAKGKTIIGENSLLMAYVHIAHDCIIGNNVILVNSVNLAGEVITMNLAAEKALGWKRQDLKGKPIKTIIPVDQHKQHEKITLLCQNNVPILKMESKRWTRTGQVFPVAVSLVLLKDADGNPTSIANITWDISEIKNLELKQRNLKKQLGHH